MQPIPVVDRFALSNANEHLTLTTYEAAQLYTGIGWSVLPLRPDDKRPAVPQWDNLKRRRAGQMLLAHWFNPSKTYNLGIITGRISQLLVLDFDSLATFSDFKRAFPEYVQTRIIRTRRGYHLYFHIPMTVIVNLPKAPAIDPIWGGYVVAPPSVINDHLYSVDQGGSPRTLHQQAHDRIQRYLQDLKPAVSPPIASPAEEPVPTLTGDHLRAIYLACAPDEGRNNALFRLSVLGRDNGLSQADVTEALIETHIHQRGRTSERPDQRRREGERTIRSAFSRPARRAHHARPRTDGLPNAVREYLAGHDRTYLIRVLDGLRLKGIQPGMPFTRKEALALLRGVVGRDSIDKALKTLLSEEFKSLNPLATPNKTPNGVAYDAGVNTISKCLEITISKSGISHPAHRPARIFTMPGNAQLARILGIPLTPISDPLTIDDMGSSCKTRQAMHRFYIARRPGQYPRQWLAKRLGVSITTLWRYNTADSGINIEPRYSETPLNWFNLESAIPDSLPHDGFFIIDTTGKRYPARRDVARYLLGVHQRISLMRRRPNYYWYGQLPTVSATNEKAKPHIAINQPIPAIYITFEPIKGNTVRPVAQHKRRAVTKSEHEWTVEDELFVQQLHQQLNGVGAGQISMANARQLVKTHGSANVKAALKRMNKRRGIQSPIGFLITLLRSESRFLRTS